MGTNSNVTHQSNVPPTLLRFLAQNADVLGLTKTAQESNYWDFAATADRPGFRVESSGVENIIYLWAEAPQPIPQWVHDLISQWEKVLALFPNPEMKMEWQVVWKYAAPKRAETAAEPARDKVECAPPSLVEFLRMHLGEYGLTLDSRDEGKTYHMVIAATGERNTFALNTHGIQLVDVTIWTVEARSGVPEWLDELRAAYEVALLSWYNVPTSVRLRVTWTFRLPAVPQQKMTQG